MNSQSFYKFGPLLPKSAGVRSRNDFLFCGYRSELFGSKLALRLGAISLIMMFVTPSFFAAPTSIVCALGPEESRRVGHILEADFAGCERCIPH